MQHADVDAGWRLGRYNSGLNLHLKTQHSVVRPCERVDRLTHHGYGVHHAVPGGKGGESISGAVACVWMGWIVGSVMPGGVDVVGIGR